MRRAASHSSNTAAGTGGDTWYPWAWSQPNRASLRIRLGVLDPLGHHPQAQAVGEVDARRHHCGGALVAVQRGHEGAVELELVDREFAEVGERAVPDAEVVDGDADAAGAQSPEDVARAAPVVEQERLGDLEHERRRREVTRGEHGADPFGQAGIEKRTRREVDRDRKPLAANVPHRGLVECEFQDALRQCLHQAGVLDEFEEVARVEQAAFGMVPAHESLDPAHLPAGEVDFRLIVQHQLVRHERRAQFLEGAQPGVAMTVVDRVVDTMPASPHLGAVHRHVGLAHQDSEARTVLGAQGDPDARARLQRDAFERVRCREGGLHLDRDHFGVFPAGIAEEDREFVAAEAHEEVVHAELGADPQAHLHEEHVADVVPETVVDLFEPVQVQKEQGVVAAEGQPGGHLGVEGPPVRQPGEVIAAGQPREIAHPAELPEREDRTGGRHDEGGRGERHRHLRLSVPAGHQQDGESGDCRENGNREHTGAARRCAPTPCRTGAAFCHAPGVRAWVDRAGVARVRGRGGPQPRRDECEPDRPTGIEPVTDHVGAAEFGQGEEDVPRGEREQPTHEQDPALACRQDR
nr:hypothetical protein [Cryobacterium breve]